MLHTWPRLKINTIKPDCRSSTQLTGKYFRHLASKYEHLPSVAEATQCLSTSNSWLLCNSIPVQNIFCCQAAVGELSAEGVWVVLF